MPGPTLDTELSLSGRGVGGEPSWIGGDGARALVPGVHGSGVTVYDLGFRVWGLGFRVWGLEFGV